MIRVIIGSAAAAVAMFVIGFIFFGPIGLGSLGTVSLADGEAAAVQQSLAANLPRTGTYFVPDAGRSAAQTVMYGQGPVATIHYNTDGFAAWGTGTIVGGLLFNLIVALLIGVALLGIGRQVPDFASRARLALTVAVAASAFAHLGDPIYHHHGWGHAIYVFIADSLMLAAAGLIVAWFMPTSRAAPADAPTDV